jgi:hypothetical protein
MPSFFRKIYWWIYYLFRPTPTRDELKKTLDEVSMAVRNNNEEFTLETWACIISIKGRDECFDGYAPLACREAGFKRGGVGNPIKGKCSDVK